MKKTLIKHPKRPEVRVLPSTQRASDENTVRIIFKRVTTQYLRTGSNPDPGLVKWRKTSIETRLLNRHEVKHFGLKAAMEIEDKRVMSRFRKNLMRQV